MSAMRCPCQKFSGLSSVFKVVLQCFLFLLSFLLLQIIVNYGKLASLTWNRNLLSHLQSGDHQEMVDHGQNLKISDGKPNHLQVELTERGEMTFLVSNFESTFTKYRCIAFLLPRKSAQARLAGIFGLQFFFTNIAPSTGRPKRSESSSFKTRHWIPVDWC